jgi:glycosyltransferase involved in cell wall biosynthesis
LSDSPPVLSVVVPVYNEENTILELIERVRQSTISKEIIVVDDCSTDRTRALLAQLEDDAEVRLFYGERNRGRGYAVRLGWREARGQYVIHQDADLEYDPRDYERLLEPILSGRADVVYGSRFLGEGMFLLQSLGNRALVVLTNLLYGTRITDLMTCYKVFRTELLTTLSCVEDGFELEPEITARVLGGGWRLEEVPIGFKARDYAGGKKMKAKHFLTVLWCLVRHRFSRR